MLPLACVSMAGVAAEAMAGHCLQTSHHPPTSERRKPHHRVHVHVPQLSGASYVEKIRECDWTTVEIHECDWTTVEIHECDWTTSEKITRIPQLKRSASHVEERIHE